MPSEVPVAAYSELVQRVLRVNYPYNAAHPASGPDDVDVTPERLHPAFHGCFDWHSSVHMHWSLVRLATLAPDRVGEGAIALLDERLTVTNVGAEADYLRLHPGWERPYGWAWSLALAAAAATSDHPHAPAWATATHQLANAVSDLVLAWLPRQVYPVRHGVHANTAFALALIHQAAGPLDRPDVVQAVAARAQEWFETDRDAPMAIEPSGSDFLSPTLTEIELMRRVLEPVEFTAWLEAFAPGLGVGASSVLTTPEVRDRTDGHFVHLYGLGLSRAWVLRSLASTWAADDPRATTLCAAADAQEAFALPAVVEGDFMSTHWLVSFALLAAGLES